MKARGECVSNRWEMRVAPSPYRHFERSEKSSLHTGQIKNVRGAVNTVLHTTWNDGLPHMYAFPVCKKDTSAALGMTKREDGLSYISFHPAARANLRPFGAPPSRGRREKFKILFPPWGRQRNENTAAPHQSLPLVGKVASGASRIGHWRYERQMRKTEKCAAHVWKA